MQLVRKPVLCNMLGVKVIDFTGGEPLLHRQLPELLAMAKELGFITTITTNTLLYPKRATQLAGLVDMLHFSLDAWEADLHNEMRGVNCYNSVMHSIEIAPPGLPEQRLFATDQRWRQPAGEARMPGREQHSSDFASK